MDSYSTRLLNKMMMYEPLLKKKFAVVLKEKYVFRHIFKNAGTMVNTVTKREHMKRGSFVTMIRDPIDNFLNG